MKRNPAQFVLIFAAIISSLSACQFNAVQPSASPTAMPATFTATAMGLPPTWTMTAPPAVPSPTLGPTTALTATSQPVTGTPSTVTPQGTASFSTTGDSAAFVSDVTIPDGTVFKAGETFTKTWRITNNGSTTWTTGYSVVYVRGNLNGASLAIPLSAEVPAGKTIDISVDFTAPAATGQYSSLWMLKNSSGQLFGIGVKANEPFFVLINVALPVSGTVTQTTTTPGSAGVSAATLSIDQTSYSGSCPVTLNLTGTITFSGSGALSYQLEAGSNTPGFTFTLPGPQTDTFSSSGSHTLPVSYYLDISSSVDGWIRLYVSAPNTLRSTQVDFKVTCK